MRPASEDNALGGGLALLALLLVLGTSAKAAGGIGVNLRVHAHNISQAVKSPR
jgi:hypothetical protein